MCENYTYQFYTGELQFCTRVLCLNPSSAASLPCARGKSVPFSGPQFLLQNDDTNSLQDRVVCRSSVSHKDSDRHKGGTEQTPSILIIIIIITLPGSQSWPVQGVCAHWPTMEVRRQLIALGLRSWDTEDNLSMALSLTASSLENSTAGRLRLREGSATLKVTQHSSSRDWTRTWVSFFLCPHR